MTIHAGTSAAARAEAGSGAAPAAGHDIKYREDAASYVAAMLAELRQIAGKAGLDRLVKSIDAAYYDAYGALDARSPEAAPAARDLPREKISRSMEPKGG